MVALLQGGDLLEALKETGIKTAKAMSFRSKLAADLDPAATPPSAPLSPPNPPAPLSPATARAAAAAAPNSGNGMSMASPSRIPSAPPGLLVPPTQSTEVFREVSNAFGQSTPPPPP